MKLSIRLAAVRAAFLLVSVAGTAQTITTSIRRSGDRLYEDLNNNGVLDAGETFRSVGMAVPGMFYHADQAGGASPVLTSDLEMRDHFRTLVQMGARMTRTYTLSFKKSSDGAGVPRHMTAAGTYNEAAFQRLDRMLQLANEHGIRVMIPVIDHWSHIGGIAEFAAFRGKSASAFYTDATLKQDYKDLVTYLLNRINTYTGVQYKNDKAILAWQTGNELEAPDSWQQEMAAHFKSISPNQLVATGMYVLTQGIRTAQLNDPNIDIIDPHYYGYHSGDMSTKVAANAATCSGKKPMIIGEFGQAPSAELTQVLDIVAANPHIAAACLWSLRGHTRIGGLYSHVEQVVGGVQYRSYNWPGRPAGDAFEETTALNLVRSYAYSVRGLAAPTRPPPYPVSEIVATATKNALRFFGASGAVTYQIERASSSAGPWTRISSTYSDWGQAYNHDVLTTYTPYNDTTAPAGTVYYRVRGVNPDGVVGGWSPVTAITGLDTKIDNASGMVTYTGSGWSHAADAGYYAGTKSVASTAGNSASLTFSGTGIAIYAKRASACGQFQVLIDGVSQGTVDTYAPSDQFQVMVFSKTGLAAGSHTVQVNILGTKSSSSSATFVGIDYFAY